MSQDTRPDRSDRPRDRRTKPQDEESKAPGPPKPPTAPATLRALDQMAEKAGDFLKNLIQTEGQVVQVGGVGSDLALEEQVLVGFGVGMGEPTAPQPQLPLTPAPTTPGLASLIRDMEGFLAVEVPRGLTPGELTPAITQFITRLKEI